LVGFEDKLHRFSEILASLVERGALRICAGQLLNESNVPFGYADVDGG